MAVALFLLILPPPPPRLPSRYRNRNPNPRFGHKIKGVCRCCCCRSTRRREAMTNAAVFSIASLTPLRSFAAEDALPESSESANSSRKSPILGGISNTKSWFQFFGDGFAIRVPPLFEDITEPEDYSTGFTFYGDKAKSRTFAARFASPDRSFKCGDSAIQSAQDYISRGQRYHRFRLTEGGSKDICPWWSKSVLSSHN